MIRLRKKEGTPLIDGMYVMNPGSCHGYGATYGIIDISDKGILTNIASAK